MSLLLISPASWGLETDRQQPIHIQADRISVHEKEGMSYYEGNVEFTQGSLQINGDEITVQLQGNILKKIIVKGNPATLQQRPEPEQELVHSRALRMEYDAVNQVITLMEEAQVQQGPNSFTGEYIEYDTHTNRVSARKGESNDSRVNVIITPPPEKQDEKVTP
ncbi:MAG: lipopolysaccharide transport periplasmic protein LptA [Thiohalomonadales bacterium]|nr:lipopolysaccharide transport periplasmic protein LptA [Thiohalomonadales bacterium]